jgi:ribosomal protein S18 acetylase RimI-like enzyme
MTAVRDLPTPALRWVGAAGRIALRNFDFASDNAAISEFQRETYSSNFPDFRWNDSFANAFRHDLRRASLDAHHGIFVLDAGKTQTPRIIGFLWIVICENSWTRERFGYINNISVLGANRGQGLGRALMTHSDDWLQSKGIRRSRLTVTATNEAARHLYEECGFRVTRLEMDKDL